MLLADERLLKILKFLISYFLDSSLSIFTVEHFIKDLKPLLTSVIISEVFQMKFLTKDFYINILFNLIPHKVFKVLVFLFQIFLGSRSWSETFEESEDEQKEGWEKNEEQE